MRFTKMQGVGNDFVVIDAGSLTSNTSLPKLAIRTCDRHFGIGADGLLAVSRNAPEAAFRMQMFNPDGTEDMCGNGLRCVTLWAHRNGWLKGETNFKVAVKDGVRAVRLLEVSEDASLAQVSVDMGVPYFEPDKLPFRAPPGERIIGYPLRVAQETFPVTVINTGSTHAVIFGDHPNEEVFQRISPQIENHPLFPERTSIMWATPTGDDKISIRIWERGAGETLGCGTGACAVAVAAVVNGFGTPCKPLDIVSRGGALQITWPGEDLPIDMVGPAQVVFEGEIEI